MYFMYDLFGVLVGYIFVADSFHTFRGFVVKGLNIMYVTFPKECVVRELTML